MDAQQFLDNFATVAEAPGGVQRLRDLVLGLAVTGQLVPHDTNAGAANRLISDAADLRADLVKRGLVPKPRAFTANDDPPPFTLPSTWAWTNLDSISVYIQRGKNPKYASAQTSTPVVSQKCVQWSGFDLGPARYVVEDSLSGYGPERFLQPGDLLWNSTGTGTVGRVIAVPDGLPVDRVVADSHVTVIRLANSHPQFVRAWLASTFVQSRIEELTSGTTQQQELNTSTVRGLGVPVPPRPEQERIVAKLDELMRLCDDLEARRERRHRATTRFRSSALHALTEAETPSDLHHAWERVSARWPALTDRPGCTSVLRQAIMQLGLSGRLVASHPDDEPVEHLLEQIQVFREALPRKRGRAAPQLGGRSEGLGGNLPQGWAEVSLGEITQIVRGITFPASAKHQSPGPDLVPCLRTANIQAAVEWDDLIFVPSSYVKEPAQMVRPGDLLMSMANSRELVGKVALVDSNPPSAAFGGFLAALRPLVVSPRFLQLILQDPRAKPKLIDSATQTTNIANISLGRLRPFRVPLPPLAEQERIVACVDSLMALSDRLDESLNAAEQLQSSLGRSLASV